MVSGRDGNEAFEVMPDDAIRRVELALDDLRAGRMVILIDDEDRENEGDLVLAAELVTPEAINFMAVHARGLICLSMTGEQVEQLEIPMMAQNNKSAYETAFTVSIEAREGVTTGISAADRAHTILTAVSPSASPRDVVVPGHIFPLRARSGGVLERTGQTEGSVDLARLAGLNPSGVICEIMNPDGTMSRLPELKEFGREHQIRICAVADIIQYRLQRERMVERVMEGTLNLPGMGEWSARLYRGVGVGGDHLALWKGDLSSGEALCRVQTAPPGWGSFGPGASRSSDILLEAARQIAEEGRGALVLMHLASSSDHLRQQFIKDSGGDAQAPAPTRMDALRDLGAGCQILLDVGLTRLRLLSNTKRPVIGTEAYGIEIVEWLEVDV